MGKKQANEKTAFNVEIFGGEERQKLRSKIVSGGILTVEFDGKAGSVLASICNKDRVIGFSYSQNTEKAIIRSIGNYNAVETKESLINDLVKQGWVFKLRWLIVSKTFEARLEKNDEFKVAESDNFVHAIRGLLKRKRRKRK
ncbi:MAG: hypothetical protein WCG91_04295 [Candidatus Shapirobacteria bacterium]